MVCYAGDSAPSMNVQKEAEASAQAEPVIGEPCDNLYLHFTSRCSKVIYMQLCHALQTGCFAV